MRAIHRRTFLRTSAAGALLLAAPAIVRGQSGEPVKIGVSMPTQGVFALHGEAGTARHRLRARPAWRNRARRPAGPADPCRQVDAARSAAERDQAHRAGRGRRVIGGSNSGPGLAIASVIAQAHIPAIISGATAKGNHRKGVQPLHFPRQRSRSRLRATSDPPPAEMGVKNWYFVYGAYASGEDAYRPPSATNCWRRAGPKRARTRCPSGPPTSARSS